MSEGSIFVTGGTGFIGRHLVWHLAQLFPRKIIRVLSRHEGAAQLYADLPNVECVVGDLTRADTLSGCLDQVGQVFHLAALKGQVSEVQPECLFHEVNVEATRTILHLCAERGVSVFMYMSSTGVYGENSVLHCDESAPCVPGNVYERTKWEAENVVRGCDACPSMRRLILRPSNVFGEDHPQRHLLTLMKSIKNGRFATLMGREAWVNYVYVKDVAYSAVCLAQNEEAVGTYTISDPMPVVQFADLIRRCIGTAGSLHRYPYFATLTVAVLLDMFGQVTGQRYPLTAQKVRALANQQVFVSDRLRDTCPDYPMFGIEEGLQNTVSHYQAQGWL
jgi:nucleoside-diphosphate-sugar epimerase